MMDDMELLREYALHDSETAFETILNRHVNLVYSAALRQVRDPVLAKEVTQSVFIILARKARSLRSGTVLSGWLYRTARFAANRALRTESRRREHEREAAQMQTEPSHSIWEQLAPVLDEAMAHLSDIDRNAVLLRYFENKTSKDVGAALGVNEAAAQKRVARATEKLRVFFSKRGLVLPALALTTALSAHAVQAAPAGMVSATAIGTGATVPSTASLAKATLKLIAWTKLKTAALIAVGLLLAAGTATITLVAMTSPPDPIYQGRPLSSWLQQLDDGYREQGVQLPWGAWPAQVQRSAQQAQAADAVLQIGTNALPYLLHAMTREDSTFKSKLNQLLSKDPSRSSNAARHRQSTLALDVLGPVAKPAIPKLTQALHAVTSSKEAAIALAATGPDGWAVLSREISSTNEAAIACSIWALGSHHVTVPETIPSLMVAVTNNIPLGIGALSAWALAEIGQNREQVVPLLITGLKSSEYDLRWSCARALGKLGPNARIAVPALIDALQDRTSKVRNNAAEALWQIDSTAATQAGVTAPIPDPVLPMTKLLN
ncbi:MAG: hypothetical protein JWQ71_4486 [Pedosphaera sp.]|nr:hypothetical protein [Pedosphaera sp.]